MSTEVSLKMKFKDQFEKPRTLNLNHCKEDISNEEQKALMDLIIEKDIFATSGGSLVEKVSSQVVKTTSTAFEIIND